MRKLWKVGRWSWNDIIKINTEARDWNVLLPRMEYFIQKAMEGRPIGIISEKPTAGWKKSTVFWWLREDTEREKWETRHNSPVLLIFGFFLPLWSRSSEKIKQYNWCKLSIYQWTMIAKEGKTHHGRTSYFFSWRKSGKGKLKGQTMIRNAQV